MKGLKFYHFILLLLGINMSPALLGQNTSESSLPPHLKHELGFAAGSSIGYGPAYKIRMQRWASMATFAPNVRYGNESYMAGLSFQYVLQTTPVSHFFLYQGNRLISRTRYDYTWNLPPFSPPWMTETFKEFLFSHSIGLGYEMFSRPDKLNPLGLSFMAGWAAYDNFKSGTFALEMSILYKFRRN
jgi:hypothetical protein